MFTFKKQFPYTGERKYKYVNVIRKLLIYRGRGRYVKTFKLKFPHIKKSENYTNIYKN